MSFTTRPELRGTFGMVASTHWLASGAGMSVLERGGDTFDAAVAAGFVLQVVEPHLNGPGGDVPAIFSSGGEVRVLCGQGPAPAAATIDAYASRGLELVPGTGPLAAVVPGAFDAWALMLRDFGTWELADVMAPAIGYARDGYPVVPGIVAAIDGMEERFRGEWPSSAEIYLPAPRAGRLFRNLPLADAYGRLARSAGSSREARIDAARDAFYRGWVAEAVHAFFAAEDGLLTGADLAGWEATLEAPITLDYHGHTICKTGPWGQGPVMLQTLALLAGFDLAAMGPGADFVHTVIECAKLAFADREAWYGDPDFTDVPIDALLSAAYADERRALIGDAASRELRPGAPGGRDPQLPGIESHPPAAAMAGSGEPTLGLAGDTCHLDVADRHGNLVSATPSGGWLHGSPIVPGLGFCLGTRAQMFWLTEGLPNSLEPGKRPRTTLTPTLVAPRRRALHGDRDAGRRHAGAVAARRSARPPPLRAQPAGGDRRPELPLQPHAELVLPPRGASERDGDRGAGGVGDDRRAAAARPRRRRAPAVVAGAGQRGGARARRAAEGRREPARDAGLRGRALIARCSSASLRGPNRSARLPALPARNAAR